jgi:Purine catabolism regulatory protein-like family.
MIAPSGIGTVIRDAASAGRGGAVLTLAQFLALPAVRDAAPEEAVAPASPDPPVRWVHSSEIYEIGPLLSAGDLLLTTGLGLAGVDAGARRHWVRELAGRGVTAVAVELGRSLPELPGSCSTRRSAAGCRCTCCARWCRSSACAGRPTR